MKTDLLHVSIVDIYCNLKKSIDKYSGHSTNVNASGEQVYEVSEEEQKRLLRLGNLVLADYVRSMVDILL